MKYISDKLYQLKMLWEDWWQIIIYVGFMFVGPVLTFIWIAFTDVPAGDVLGEEVIYSRAEHAHEEAIQIYQDDLEYERNH